MDNLFVLAALVISAATASTGAPAEDALRARARLSAAYSANTFWCEKAGFKPGPRTFKENVTWMLRQAEIAGISTDDMMHEYMSATLESMQKLSSDLFSISENRGRSQSELTTVTKSIALRLVGECHAASQNDVGLLSEPEPAEPIEQTADRLANAILDETAPPSTAKPLPSEVR